MRHLQEVYCHQTSRNSLLTITIEMLICDALRGLVPFVQFKKREKKPMEEY